MYLKWLSSVLLREMTIVSSPQTAQVYKRTMYNSDLTTLLLNTKLVPILMNFDIYYEIHN